jgi:hypothetical protein
MTSRRKNLLEAFKRSDAPGAPPPAPPREPPPTTVGDLFGQAGARPPRAGGRPAWLLPLVGMALTFVLGFLIGRGAPRAARAGEGEAPAGEPPPLARPANQPRSFQRQPAATDAPKAAGEPRIEESALFDARNAWTVIVASYSLSNKDLAWATYQHLRDAELAVFPPVESRNLVVVLVGAAPTAAALADTEAAVRALVREGKKAYADAYAARIDTLIPRTPKQEKKP